MSVYLKFSLAMLVLGAAGCEGTGAAGPPSAAGTASPRINRSSVAAPVMERFRPEMAEYLTEIQQAQDYGNWKTAPASAFTQ